MYWARNLRRQAWLRWAGGVLVVFLLYYYTTKNSNLKSRVREEEEHGEVGHAAGLPNTDELPTPQEEYVERQCVEQQNIYFLKVIKAGSTTIQNIIWRYGLSRNLTFMIFRGKYPYPSSDFHPKLVESPDMKASRSKHNIMAEHSVYNESVIKETMPKDTARIAIVREPLSHLRSVFKFFKLGQRLGIEDYPEDPVNEFLQNPLFYAERNTMPILHNTQNRIAFEFGYPHWHYQYPPGDFEDFTDQLDNRFRLVLVLELLNESLVLLKRYFCWTTKDVLFLPLRQKLEAPAIEELPDFDESTELELSRVSRDWSATDAALYDFFHMTLIEKTREQPADFPREVTWFTSVIEKTTNFCESICNKLHELRKPEESVLFKDVYKVLQNKIAVQKSPWDRGFDVTGEDCVLMALDPNVYRAVEFARHFPAICRPHPSAKLENLAQEMKFDKVYCGIEGERFPFSILASDKFSLSDVLLFCSK